MRASHMAGSDCVGAKREGTRAEAGRGRARVGTSSGGAAADRDDFFLLV